MNKHLGSVQFEGGVGKPRNVVYSAHVLLQTQNVMLRLHSHSVKPNSSGPRHEPHAHTPLRSQRPKTLAYLWQHVLDMNFMLTLPLCRKGQNSCLHCGNMYSTGTSCSHSTLPQRPKTLTYLWQHVLDMNFMLTLPLCRKGQNACLRNELHALMLRLYFAVKPKRLSDTFAACQLSLCLP